MGSVKSRLGLAALPVAIVQSFQNSAIFQSSANALKRPVSLKRSRSWVVPHATADGDAAASDAIPGMLIASTSFQQVRIGVPKKHVINAGTCAVLLNCSTLHYACARIAARRCATQEPFQASAWH
jgi:3-hydroxyisobutyrate dehydrogenase-like beta-hydroxyacid dehydrogenase